MSGVDAVLISIIPSLGVGLIFWYVMRAVIRADRRERACCLFRVVFGEFRAAAEARVNSETKGPSAK